MALRDWLQLVLTEGIGPILLRRLVNAAGSAADAAKANESLLRTVEGIGSSKARSIAAALKSASEQADRELAQMEAAGVSAVSYEDAEYPSLLRHIPDPPGVLYLRGALQPRDLNAIAIVGSRRCTHYGREQAERLAMLLAQAGMTIVSGGARGVDSAAHRGAIMPANGRTIAVLGSGIDVVYPPENDRLFRTIAEHGAVLSEFPMGTPPNKENFPRRNRIVSGISRGVLVIEADVASGALITARQAADDHNRPVFALPGRVDNPMSAGPHSLIRDGAMLVANLDDILDGLGPLPADAALPPADEMDDVPEPPALFAEPAPAAAVMPELSERQVKIVASLSREPSALDQIITASQQPAEVVLQELTMLTLRGVVRRVDGQNFALRR